MALDLSLAASAVAPSAGVATNKVADTKEDKGFLSLLAIGDSSADTQSMPVPSVEPNTRSVQKPNKKHAEPVAAEAQASARLESGELRKRETFEPRVKASQERNALKATDAPEKAEPMKPAAQKLQETDVKQPAITQEAAGETGQESLDEEGKSLLARVREMLGDMSLALASLLQSVAGGKTAQGTDASVAANAEAALQAAGVLPGAATATSGMAVSPEVSQILQQLLAGSTNGGALGADDAAALATLISNAQNGTIPSLPTSAGETLTTALADLESVLSQVQAMPGASSELADTTQGLKTQLAALTQLVHAATQTAGQAQAAPATQEGASSDVASIIAQIKTGLSEVKEQLDGLKVQNEQAFAKVKAQFAAVQPQNAAVVADPSVQKPATDNAVSAAFAQSLRPSDIPVDAASNSLAASGVAPQPSQNSTQTAAQTVVNFIPASQAAVQVNAANSSAAVTDFVNSQVVNGAQAQSSALPGQTQLGGSQAASKTPFGEMMSRTSPQSVLEQVSVNIRTAAVTGESKITIRLDPAELGKLDIKMSVDASGKTGIAITADNRSTLDLLQRDSQGLMRALADAGLQADSNSLSFNLRGGQDDSQNQNGAKLANNYSKAQPEDDLDSAMNVINKSYVVNLASGLDIKI